MAEIKLTINGKDVVGEKGDSVLNICEKNGIHVPTLCHQKRLIDTGACRMCLVEIEGARGYRPACCTEANEGMVVKTDTDEIKRLRRTMLEFLFSERNHFCMFCESSGDCELQNLAYEHGIEHAKYDYAQPHVRVDSSRYYFVFDENRCILCMRCIRACSEIAGHNVLDLGKRGADARIIADLNVPFGESTCTSCGTCLQVCPTGALIDRASSYLGRMAQCDVTKTTCSACSIGCGIEVITRDNHILKITGDWDTPVSKGVLCVAGRFEPLHIQKERITKSMIKRNGTFEEVELNDALDYVAKKFQEVGMKNVFGFISPKATNEEASIFSKILGAAKVAESGPHTVMIENKDRVATLNDVESSDCILIYKADLDKESRVVGSFVKLDVYKHDANLIVVDDKANSFDRHANMVLKPGELNSAKDLIERASNPVIIYGTNTNAHEVESLMAISGKTKMMGLLAGANSKGLRNMGIDGKVDAQSAKALYILAYDDELKKFDRYNASFVVLQASYLSPETEKADVILPSTIWSEEDGSITNIDGLVQKVVKAINAPEGVQSNKVTMELLSSKLG
ncbi:MAG: formate dehydrogenase major subunit [Candidatus Poribacteria bacterium]|nr:formate dehydrogenase major subunit [Candidatus Poribacteria bacterium]